MPLHPSTNPSHWPRFEQRMRRVIDHVHAHLDEPLDLMWLADIAHLSPHHRIYQALYGETMAATVKRLPLHRAAGWLANSALRAQACVAGCAPGDLPSPLIRTAIAAAEYAVLVHTGPYASMGAAYRWLFGAWLAGSGRQPADAPVVEEYLNSPRETAPADLVTHIFLPLRPI